MRRLVSVEPGIARQVMSSHTLMLVSHCPVLFLGPVGLFDRGRNVGASNL